MKLHIDGIIFSLQKNGGISVYFRELISHLSNRKQFIDSTLSIDAPSLQNISQLTSFFRFENRPARFLERYRNCRVSKNTKVFHSSYYRLPDTKQVPTVVTVHDFIYERYRSGIARTAHILQKHTAIRQAQAIICVSESTREDLMEFVGVRSNQSLHVIHNGVSSIFRPLTQTSFEYKNPFLLYIGERRGYKNFNLVIAALKYLPHFELHCIGGGTFRNEELRGVSTSIRKRIKHLGYLSDSDLNIAYNRAICLVYPSQYEGFGIPVIEAMRSGCPVVSIPCKAVNEIGGDALEQADDDPLAIAEAILRLTSASYRQIKIASGIQQSKKFDWAKCHNATQEIYNSLA